jgi:hypothetical protein
MKQSQIAVWSVCGVFAGFILIFAGFARIALSGVEPTSSGEQISKSRDLTGFNGIEIEGSWRVNVIQGDEWQVDVSYPENREDDIEVYVRGDRLKLDHGSSGRWWGRNEQTIRADIVMPELEELELAGSSHLELSGFEGSRLEVDIAGAIFLEGRDGRYDELDLSVAGASKIDLQGIVVTDAEVDLAGASDVTLSIDGGELSGSLAGAGQIEYYGSVSDEDIEIAGFGRVNRVE